MAVFADIKGNPQYMKHRESFLLQGMNDTQISNLYAEQAKTDLQLDINEMTGIAISDTAEYDRIATEHEERLTHAMSIRQLWYLMNEHFETEGVNAEKFQSYLKEYARIKQSFRGLETTQGASKVRVFRARL